MRKIFQTTLFLPKVSLVLLHFMLTSCSAQLYFKDVITGKEISKGVNIVYNREAIIKIDTIKVFVSKIERYDKKLNLLEVDISKAESMLTYSRKELNDDNVLIDSYNITLDRSETLKKSNNIIDKNKSYEIIYKSKDTIMSKKDNAILIFINK